MQSGFLGIQGCTYHLDEPGFPGIQDSGRCFFDGEYSRVKYIICPEFGNHYSRVPEHRFPVDRTPALRGPEYSDGSNDLRLIVRHILLASKRCSWYFASDSPKFKFRNFIEMLQICSLMLFCASEQAIHIIVSWSNYWENLFFIVFPIYLQNIKSCFV